MCRVMEQCGILVERQHHEVATAGQAEIDIRFDSLVRTADKLMWFKYIIKNVALRNGKTVTFMPKPLFGDNGSGMHTHQSIWKGGKPLFAGDGYAGMSDMALHYIGGILKHARALAAICNPTTNSYKRLVPGFEAPVNLAYSSRNRSAAIRIPMYSPSPKAKRLEYRPPDPSCNPYLAFAAMLMAGLDGIENRIDPGDPLDKDIYGLSPEELKDVPKMPGSLEEALGELKKDHEFLLKGDVFTEDVIETWIEHKIEKELNPVRPLRAGPSAENGEGALRRARRCGRAGRSAGFLDPHGAPLVRRGGGGIHGLAEGAAGARRIRADGLRPEPERNERWDQRRVERYQRVARRASLARRPGRLARHGRRARPLRPLRELPREAGGGARGRGPGLARSGGEGDRPRRTARSAIGRDRHAQVGLHDAEKLRAAF